MIRRALVTLMVAVAVLAGFAQPASAHPLGNFTVNHYSLIEVDRGAVRVTYVIDMAEIPTFQALGSGDRSRAAAQAYALAHIGGWAGKLDLSVNGRPVALAAGTVTASLRLGQAGLEIMRVQAQLTGAVPGAGPFTLTYHDHSFDGQLGWREIVMRAGSGAVLTRSSVATQDVSHMLRHYPTGLLQTPMQVTGASASYRYGSGRSVTVAPQVPGGGVAIGTSETGFTSLIGHSSLTPGFVALALALAIAWGALHALSPGHGKSIVAAYLIGSRGTARHAAFLGATVTITHTTGVFALGMVALLLSHYIVPETLYPWLGVLSGLLVIVMGASILSRRLSSTANRRGPDHHHHHHGHDHDHGHHHDHGHDHHDHAGHTHLPPGADGSPITRRSLLMLGISGGILPCPSALVVMLGAIALHRIAFGLVLVLAFSLGLALTLTSIGLVVVYARRLIERAPVSGGRVTAWIPVFSAGVITLLGVGVTVQALDTFPGGTSAVLARVAQHSPMIVVGLAVLAVLARLGSALRRRHPRTLGALVPTPTPDGEAT
jgi:nickel/cobalt transporter (NicO) family protein